MEQLYLSTPDIKHKDSFKKYVLSYKNVGDTYYYEKYKMGIYDFERYIDILDKMSMGIELRSDEVQTSSFWLISMEEVVGVVRVRHKELDNAGHIGYDISPSYRNQGYGNAILTLAIEKAKIIGITNAIVTCKVSNFASSKIISNNGGKLLCEIYDDEDNEYYLKYSISIN